MSRHVAILPLCVALVAPIGTAHALLLCGRKNPATGALKEGTSLKVRTACKPSEVALPISLEDAGQTVRFTGVNVQIVSGTGATDVVNGRGNLIVGYDEMDPGEPLVRSGSHNLVVGSFNSYASYAGAAIGTSDTISAPFALATGVVNTASGDGTAVVGGQLNAATAPGAAVVGGGLNQATAAGATAVGGLSNQAMGPDAAVVGGRDDVASGFTAVVAGGRQNHATGENAAVSGGNGVTQSVDDGWSAGSLGTTVGAAGFSSP